MLTTRRVYLRFVCPFSTTKKVVINKSRHLHEQELKLEMYSGIHGDTVAERNKVTRVRLTTVPSSLTRSTQCIQLTGHATGNLWRCLC